MAQTLVRGLPRRLLVALGLSVCLSASVSGWSSASAQTVVIPDAVITSSVPLNRDQTAQIAQLVAESVPDLSSDDPELVGQARNRLLAPLEKAGIGVPFRLAYSNALTPELEPLARDERELTAVNALRILGEIATDRATLAVETAVDHPGVGIRYTAVYGLARTFDAVATESPAVAPPRIEQLISRLAELVRNEPDPWILDVAVRALVAAGSIDKENYENIRAMAYASLCEAASTRVRTLPMEEDGVDRLFFILRAGVAARDALTDQRSLPAAAASNAAALGGDTLAFAAARIQRGNIAEEERTLLTSMSLASQAMVFFAGTSISGSTPPRTPEALPDLRNRDMDDRAVRTRDQEFIRRAVAEIDRLYSSPFSFAARRFNRP